MTQDFWESLYHLVSRGFVVVVVIVVFVVVIIIIIIIIKQYVLITTLCKSWLYIYI